MGAARHHTEPPPSREGERDVPLKRADREDTRSLTDLNKQSAKKAAPSNIHLRDALDTDSAFRFYVLTLYGGGLGGASFQLLPSLFTTEVERKREKE